MTGVYNRAQEGMDEELRKRRQLIRNALATYKTVGTIVLDNAVDDQDLRRTLFNQVDPERIARQLTAIERLLTGKHSHVFNLFMDRFTYLRQFSPALLEHLAFQLEEGAQSTVVDAARLLRNLNRENRRKLPELLIEVDNELHFTRHFMLPAQSEPRAAEQVCTILATIMAHGCNIGPHTMARLTEGITYHQIKEVTVRRTRSSEAALVVLRRMAKGQSCWLTDGSMPARIPQDSNALEMGAT